MIKIHFVCLTRCYLNLQGFLIIDTFPKDCVYKDHLIVKYSLRIYYNFYYALNYILKSVLSFTIVKGNTFSCFLFLLILCSFTSFSLSGCASKFISFKDPETNAEITRMSGNRLSGGISLVELNAQRYEKSGDISYSLFIRYAGPSYLEITPGKSLVIIIDGNRFEIIGKGSEDHRNYISIGLVEEIAYYHNMEPEFIRLLCEAYNVHVEVKGSTTSIRRYFNNDNFSKFNEFYKRYIEAP